MKRTPIAGVTLGTVIGGRYQIERLLGTGGFGHVYQAIQMPLGRRVAVKLLATHQSEVSARFAREAALAQRLEHPNTVRILDFGATPEGAPFIVFELLRGKTVAELVAERGPMPLEIALDITAQVLKSLMEAHALGIVHRDIKPANVMVTSHPGEPFFVKVLDFGIAKDLHATEGGSPRAFTRAGDGSYASPTLTSASQMMGTPRYMAPEQALSEKAGPETDLYAVGLLLAEMLRGRPVFDQSDGLAIAAEQASARPVPLGGLEHTAAGATLVRSTQKARAKRYPSAAEMLADIEKLRGLGERPAGGVRVDEQRVISAITTDPTHWTPSVARAEPPTPSRRGVVIAVAAALGLGALGVLGWFASTTLTPARRPKKKRSDDEDDGDDDDDTDTETDADEPPRPVDVDWSTRVVPDDADVLPARMKRAGYTVHAGDIIDQAGFSQWVWSASKPPCGGSVLLLVYGDEGIAETSARVLTEQGRGKVLRTKNRVLFVQLMRQGGPEKDPACTLPLLDALTR